MAWDVEVDASERAPGSLKPVDDLLCFAEGHRLAILTTSPEYSRVTIRPGWPRNLQIALLNF